MKHDISDPKDIRLLVDSFYEKVRRDPLIGYLFEEIAKVDWSRHLPVMYNFWENVLFMNGAYSGNPMAAHMNLHGRSPLTKDHFDRWLQLFIETVDEHFEGEIAERARQRALSISTIMYTRIAGKGDSIQKDNSMHKNQ